MNCLRYIVPVIAIVASAEHVGADPSPSSALSGRWVAAVDFNGATRHFRVNFAQTGDALTGDFDGDPLTGSVKGGVVEISAKDPKGGWENLKGTLSGTTITGTIDIAFSGDVAHPSTHPFTATFVPLRTGKPKRHEFTPTTFYREFSAKTKPVLTIHAGDTISTWTVDAGGFDQKGVNRVTGGNPQTGPFYVEGALPGDTLVVHVDKIRLNRDYAISTDGVVPRGLNPDLAVKMKDGGNQVRWKLDRTRMLGTPEEKTEHLGNYAVPLRPMLGCVAAAPNPLRAAPGTGDSGSFGGNMDFNEITEGATVYLPVQNPGALLYFGDAHAAQGDGETTGDALETSVDVQVTVDVIDNHRVPDPRVETATHYIAMGLEGSLDEALKAATQNMATWLTDRYKLTPSEIARVLGTAAEYHVGEIADRNATIVLRIAKDRLKGIPVAK